MPIDPNIVLQTQQQPSFAQNASAMASMGEMMNRGKYYNAEANWRNADAQRMQQEIGMADQAQQKQQVQQQAMQKLTKSSMRQDGTPDYYKLYQGIASVPGMDLNKITDTQKELQPFIQHQAMDDIRKQAIMPNGYDIDHDKMTKLIASDPRLGPDAAKAFQKQMLSSADDDLKTKLAVQSHAANVFAGAVKPDGTVDPVAFQAAVTKFHGILGDQDIPQADAKSIETYKSQYQDPDQALKQRKQLLEEKQLSQKTENDKGQLALEWWKAKHPTSSPQQEFQQDKWIEGQWQSLAKATNALNTNSRSALGQSGIANVRAARAMDVLTNKDIVSDPYAFDLVNTDVQGIMKGAAPTEEQLKEKYSNLQTKLASLWQKVSANPTAVNQPGVKNQLVGIINGLRQIDNGVLDKNLGVEKVAFRKILEKDPQRAEDFYSALQGTKDVFPQGDPAQPPKSAPVSDDDIIAKYRKK